MKICDACGVEAQAAMTLPNVATVCLNCYSEWLRSPEKKHYKMRVKARLMDFINRKRAEQLNARPSGDLEKAG